MRLLRPEIRYFIAAAQFLTRLPTPHFAEFKPQWLARGAKYFPLVGALTGLLCAIVLLVAAAIWRGPLPALLAIAAGMLITGALHEDGFADFFDAMGGTTREQRLAIMKDSRLGVFGALALGLSLAMKLLALSLLAPWVAAGALIAMHAGGRLAAVLAIAILPYAGKLEAARVQPLTGSLSLEGALIAMLFGLAPSLLLPFPAAAVACTAGAAAAAFIAWRAHALLGGHTGDVLGAVEQAYEIAFLLGISACATS
jgi:adenosylcobinamide-GDP ribazoletransferase